MTTTHRKLRHSSVFCLGTFRDFDVSAVVSHSAINISDLLHVGENWVKPVKVWKASTHNLNGDGKVHKVSEMNEDSHSHWAPIAKQTWDMHAAILTLCTYTERKHPKTGKSWHTPGLKSSTFLVAITPQGEVNLFQPLLFPLHNTTHSGSLINFFFLWGGESCKQGKGKKNDGLKIDSELLGTFQSEYNLLYVNLHLIFIKSGSIRS